MLLFYHLPQSRDPQQTCHGGHVTPKQACHYKMNFLVFAIWVRRPIKVTWASVAGGTCRLLERRSADLRPAAIEETLWLVSLKLCCSVAAPGAAC